MEDIKDFEGLYAITSCGKVWSYRSKKFLKPRKSNSGYLRVDLYKDGNHKWVSIHRLVVEAYLPNPERLLEVDHIDGNKEHNYLNNLQWISHIENLKKRETGIGTPKRLICVETGEVFETMTAAAKKYGVCTSAISQAIKRQGKSAGYTWRWKE